MEQETVKMCVFSVDPFFSQKMASNADNCTLEWAHVVFKECIESDTEMASFWLALVSVVIWSTSQFPYVAKKYI